MRSGITVAALCGLIAGMPAVAADALAVIDGEPVSYEEFEQFAYAEARQTFYHGKPPEGDAMIEFRQQAANKLIERKLKVREARRRGLEPNRDEIGAKLASYEQQYASTPRWQAEGPAMLARLRAHFEEESLLQQVEPALRAVPEPDAEAVKAFYDVNLDLFTEPEKWRLSIILLAVPAWSDQEVWDAARDEAAELAERIREGLSFAEAARLHSADATAADGGDLGYAHAGALNSAVYDAVKDLQPGEMAAEPVTVLEGIVLVKLEDHKASAVRDFADVQERATGLLRRQAGDAAYAAAMNAMRDKSDIRIDEAYLKTLPN